MNEQQTIQSNEVPFPTAQAQQQIQIQGSRPIGMQPADPAVAFTQGYEQAKNEMRGQLEAMQKNAFVQGQAAAAASLKDSYEKNISDARKEAFEQGIAAAKQQQAQAQPVYGQPAPQAVQPVGRIKFEPSQPQHAQAQPVQAQPVYGQPAQELHLANNQAGSKLEEANKEFNGLTPEEQDEVADIMLEAIGKVKEKREDEKKDGLSVTEVALIGGGLLAAGYAIDKLFLSGDADDSEEEEGGATAIIDGIAAFLD